VLAERLADARDAMARVIYLTDAKHVFEERTPIGAQLGRRSSGSGTR